MYSVSPGANDAALMFPRISAKKLERLAEHGTAPFLVIEYGRVRLLDRKPGKDA